MPLYDKLVVLMFEQTSQEHSTDDNHDMNIHVKTWNVVLTLMSRTSASINRLDVNK